MDTKDLVARLETLEAELALLKAAAIKETPVPVDDTTSRATLALPESTRRGMLRYGAVALGAAAAGLIAKPAAAANGDPVLIGASNSGTSNTSVSTNSAGNNGLHPIPTGRIAGCTAWRAPRARTTTCSSPDTIRVTSCT